MIKRTLTNFKNIFAKRMLKFLMREQSGCTRSQFFN